MTVSISVILFGMAFDTPLLLLVDDQVLTYTSYPKVECENMVSKAMQQTARAIIAVSGEVPGFQSYGKKNVFFCFFFFYDADI